MRKLNLEGKTVFLTGATGGLGLHLSQALAFAGARLGLVAYPGEEIPALEEKLRSAGTMVCAVRADLTLPEGRRLFLERARETLGPPEILINNAGDEVTCPFHLLAESEVIRLLRVNLEAAVMLSHAVLPKMLAAGRGSLIHISSLAGKSGPACQEPYGAGKAGLIAFNQSLRATYRSTGVHSTVVCPGFVETGIYTRSVAATGVRAPRLLGTSRPETVVRAVLRAIRDAPPEIMVNPAPLRPLFALCSLFPRLGEALVEWTGGQDYFRRVAAKHRQNGG
ncbi:MAG TPA: SDR family NAD(P)-dependent oxidoreductase [Verrucomicrobiales bacterium]|nr:SDR family NAD(P)-dependent oxidoreductase [Verrucomicrobiales bacterium]